MTPTTEPENTKLDSKIRLRRIKRSYAESGTAPGIGGPAGSFGSPGVRTW
jgi:hypothetical protein